MQHCRPAERDRQLDEVFGHEPGARAVAAGGQHDTQPRWFWMVTRTIARLTVLLEDSLADRQVMHAVLMDILGLGVLITGESGIGKSECALDLIGRGHRLVADDTVEVRRRAETVIIGTCPELTRHLVVAGERVGFVVVRPYQGELLMDHLYVHPAHQRRGIGAAVLARVFADADAQRLPVRVGALRGSDSNRFYQRHGFEKVAQDDVDVHYRWRVKAEDAC